MSQFHKVSEFRKVSCVSHAVRESSFPYQRALRPGNWVTSPAGLGPNQHSRYQIMMGYFKVMCKSAAYLKALSKTRGGFYEYFKFL